MRRRIKLKYFCSTLLLGKRQAMLYFAYQYIDPKLKKPHMPLKRFRYIVSILTLGLLLLLTTQCAKEKDIELKAVFSFVFEDENHLIFSNESMGDYYSLTWNFGNGVVQTTTEKDKSFTIYYPEAGSYTVSLKVVNYSGETNLAILTVEIEESDISISFTTEVDAQKPNYIHLTNTTIGEYDSFKWIYSDSTVENETETTAYFPFSGSYTIKLEVSKNGYTFSSTENVIISQDDPAYIENMQLVWSDEFEGSSINTSNWTFETGASGWGNNELQNYTNGSNAQIVDGKLVITAKKVDDLTQVGSYTSSRMISENKREFKYGRFEIRAKLPSGRGIWPAIWMLGSNFRNTGWPECGEIDIMEYVGYNPNTIYATVHTPSGYGGNGDGSSKNLTTCEEEFHIYGLIWTEESLSFYTDKPENVTHVYAPSTKTANNWPFNQPAFFILNVAVGGSWGGAQGIDNAIFPQSLEIDYVRVYE
jgi:beta-glucanase (GH16 family)